MKCKRYWIVFFCLIHTVFSVFSFTGGGFYSLQFDYPGTDGALSNCPLAYQNLGFFAYTQTPGLQRYGWFLQGMLSSVPTGEYVYGSFNAGVYLGQEVKLGPFFAAANMLAGSGFTVSDLTPRAGGLQLSGEVQIELGLYVASWMQIGLFSGLQGFTNLLPWRPFTHYNLYATTLGLKLIWHAQ